MSLLTDDEIEAIWCNSNPSYFEAQSFARAIEAAILAKLASAELPEPAIRDYYGDGFTADQLRQAFAQGAASQLSAEPSGFLSQHNLEMLKQGYPQTIVMLEGAKRDVPLFTRKEPK